MPCFSILSKKEAQTMSQEATVMSAPKDQREVYRWIRCKECTGEVGIPSDWKQATAACPKCGEIVRVNDKSKVLYRPPVQGGSHSVRIPVTAAADDPEKHNNPLALISFIVGIVGLILHVIGLIPIVGIVLSAIALGSFKPETQKNRWMAGWGLALSILGTVSYLTAYGHLR
jgi:hypothetical protein